MAQDPRKRQRQLERKKAKRKEKHHELAVAKSGGLARQLKQAASAPVYECFRMEDIFGAGIGQVMFSRKLPSGQVAFGLFLVDVRCLGVKDAFGGVIGAFEYSERFGKHHRPHPTVAIEPAAARKLVEGAVAYAKELGLAPHPDYQKVREIFGDVDPAGCREEFEYGQDGMPMFVNGPYDTPARCKQILATLARTCGEGNYHFTLAAGPGGEMRGRDDFREVLGREPDDDEFREIGEDDEPPPRQLGWR